MPDAAQPLLAVSGLSKAFGGVKAVREVAFTLERGEMLPLEKANSAPATPPTNPASTNAAQCTRTTSIPIASARNGESRPARMA